MTTWMSDVDELVAGVGPGTRLGVCGFHFTRAPAP